MTPPIDFHLLRSFRSTFEGLPYRHRDSSVGDRIACSLYEDIALLDRSPTFATRIAHGTSVVNLANTVVGKRARRGDGTLGELVPTANPLRADGYVVQRGPVATMEIGAETKILAKAMIKQIDRVIGDLTRQVEEFRRRGGNPITVAIVGINQSPNYTSYEGDRPWPTDGSKHRHPIQEAEEAERRLLDRASSAFDEFLILRFKATNTSPYPFDWVDYDRTQSEYSSVLVRVSNLYEQRFSTPSAKLPTP